MDSFVLFCSANALSKTVLAARKTPQHQLYDVSVSDEAVDPKFLRVFFSAFDSLCLLTPFGLRTLFFLPLQFFLALLEGDSHGPPRKARSILPSVR
jgi:hypothetical protein